MIDINAEAEKSLSETGYRLAYCFPKEKAKLPCVTFFNITERPQMKCDNEEQIQRGWIQVDIWAKEASVCGEMLIKVNEVLTSDGWHREMSRDIPDESGIFRKVTRYAKDFIL